MNNREWEYTHQEELKMRCFEGYDIRRVICGGCGREFYTQVRSKKYCGHLHCPDVAYHKTLKQRRLINRQNTICVVCGRPFTPKRIDGVYCSNACRQKAYRQRLSSQISLE